MHDVVSIERRGERRGTHSAIVEAMVTKLFGLEKTMSSSSSNARLKAVLLLPVPVPFVVGVPEAEPPATLPLALAVSLWSCCWPGRAGGGASNGGGGVTPE